MQFSEAAFEVLISVFAYPKDMRSIKEESNAMFILCAQLGLCYIVKTLSNKKARRT